MYEIVLHFFAAYEADWQLVWMEHAKIIDAIVTQDSDILVLGAMKVVYNSEFKLENPKCQILTAEHMLRFRRSIDHRMTSADFVAFLYSWGVITLSVLTETVSRR